MRKITLIAAVTAALSIPAAATAATTTTTIAFQADVAACNGDTIQLDGKLLLTFSATLNGGGGAVFASHTQPQGVSGVDLQTGVKYIGTGLTRDLSVFAPSGTVTLTLINRFHIQATKGEQSFDVSQTLHVTQLADGTITAFVDNFSVSC